MLTANHVVTYEEHVSQLCVAIVSRLDSDPEVSANRAAFIADADAGADRGSNAVRIFGRVDVVRELGACGLKLGLILPIDDLDCHIAQV